MLLGPDIATSDGRNLIHLITTSNGSYLEFESVLDKIPDRYVITRATL